MNKFGVGVLEKLVKRKEKKIQENIRKRKNKKTNLMHSLLPSE